MENKKTGLVIKVKNLTSCKAFYRDILELGNPVLDSNFRVEFQCGNSFSLVLEKTPWDEPLQPVSDRIIWLHQMADAKTVWTKMVSYGFPVPNLSEVVAKGNGYAVSPIPKATRFMSPPGFRKHRKSEDEYETCLLLDCIN